MESVVVHKYAVHIECEEDCHSTEFEQLDDLVEFTRDQLNRAGIHPSCAKMLQVPDVAMQPVHDQGAWVLVNVAEKTIQSGCIYAVGYRDTFLIRRVFKVQEGSLMLHADNPDYEPRDQYLPHEEAFGHFWIIGKVHVLCD